MKDLDQSIIKFDYDKNLKNDDFHISKSNVHIMNFLDNVKTKYETPGSSLGKDFIRPALAECILYRRETGWFRSSALRVWAGSLIDVLQNEHSKIKIKYLLKETNKLSNLIVTPHIAGLTKESIQLTDMYVINKFLRELKK